SDVSSEGSIRSRGPIGAFDGPSGLSATTSRNQFGAVSPSAAWASLPGIDPHVMGAPLPEAAYAPQNNGGSLGMREVRSTTDATIDGRRVGAAPLPAPVSTPHSGDAMVDASKQGAPQFKSDRGHRFETSQT